MTSLSSEGSKARGAIKQHSPSIGAVPDLERLMKKLSTRSIKTSEGILIPVSGLPINEALQRAQDYNPSPEDFGALRKLKSVFGERSVTEIVKEVSRLSRHSHDAFSKKDPIRKSVDDRSKGIMPTQEPSTPTRDDASAAETNAALRRPLATGSVARKASLVGRLRMIRNSQRSHNKTLQAVLARKAAQRLRFEAKNVRLEQARRAQAYDSQKESNSVYSKESRIAEDPVKKKTTPQPHPFSKLGEGEMQTLRARALAISPVTENMPTVPRLSYDLSRVLFNPGVYHLQDPRSRVYNFDPYLERIMPVSEFDFDALKKYITSSEDDSLSQLALKRGKKFVGSSSSMTGTLAHFHFLLSQWRELNMSTLSRSFTEQLKTFTVIQRAPSAIFLRFKSGVYAIDADKEYDSANIMMSLGKSMEKLLTLKKDDFERYRKSNPSKLSEEERTAPEAYHYSELGDVLMRSQLDAHDPRLPGSGMFDLKTRAVVSIRMSSRNHEEGLGYEITSRHGGWESYEREFYDMIRSAFLKYSLQVRMGRMDGIFVAFHNIERIFGFQYVSLPEMDLHLHGQSDMTLGDQEFKLSLRMLNEIMERAVKKFPARSLRFHFETRDASTPFMYVFAEPVEEVEIEKIQKTNRAMIEEFERRIYGMETVGQAGTMNERDILEGGESTELPEIANDRSIQNGSTKAESSAMENGPFNPNPEHSTDQEESSSSLSANDADVAFLDEIANKMDDGLAGGGEASVLALVLTIRNKVNGQVVDRPENLTPSDNWTVEYTVKEIEKPDRAWSLYTACKTRRNTAMNEPEKRDWNNLYVQRLRDLAQKGAKWRKTQDELDAGRRVVTLYDDN